MSIARIELSGFLETNPAAYPIIFVPILIDPINKSYPSETLILGITMICLSKTAILEINWVPGNITLILGHSSPAF